MTNSTLTLNNVQQSDSGGYSVIVTNSYGSATSAVAQLTVSLFPPSISNDPQSQSVLVGQDVFFSVQASGTAPLGYQWYYNTNTAGRHATNSILTLTNVQLSGFGWLLSGGDQCVWLGDQRRGPTDGESSGGPLNHHATAGSGQHSARGNRHLQRHCQRYRSIELPMVL